MIHFLNEFIALFTNPETELWIKVVYAFITLFFISVAGLVFLLVLQILQMVLAPLRYFWIRRDWHALAAKEGWENKDNRQLSGQCGNHLWQMIAMRKIDGLFDPIKHHNDEAIWEMRNFDEKLRFAQVYIMPRKTYQLHKDAGWLFTLKWMWGIAIWIASTVNVFFNKGKFVKLRTEGARDWFVVDLPPVQVGSAAFQSEYVVVTHQAELAAQLINHETEAMLFGLMGKSIKPEHFAAMLEGGQFSMRCLGNLAEAELAGRFCHLGLAMTARLS